MPVSDDYFERKFHELNETIGHDWEVGEHWEECPFCGEEDNIQICELSDHESWLVICRECNAQGPLGCDRENGLGQWNERPSNNLDCKRASENRKAMDREEE